VGAAITDDCGRVVSIGTNEVAKAQGGQYWEGDAGDQRDFLFEDRDQSDKMRWNLLADVVDRLRKLNRLSGDCPTNSQLFDSDSSDYDALREAQLFDTIDFVRCVHAEASALFSAGLATRGATLYVTDFPCHECARHIVISGIKRVVYIEPYPKSLVTVLYHDSISVDADEGSDHRIQFIPFSGIAPSVYGQLFRVPSNRKRKAEDGKITKWEPLSSFPHFFAAYSEQAARRAESVLILESNQKLIEKGILNDKD
jgi:cytidine deaminase